MIHETLDGTRVGVNDKALWLGGAAAAIVSGLSVAWGTNRPENVFEFLAEHGGRHVFTPGWIGGLITAYTISASAEYFAGQDAAKAVHWGRHAGRAAVLAYSVYGEATGRYPGIGPTQPDLIGDVIGAQLGTEVAIRAIIVEDADLSGAGFEAGQDGDFDVH